MVIIEIMSIFAIMNIFKTKVTTKRRGITCPIVLVLLLVIFSVCCKGNHPKSSLVDAEVSREEQDMIISKGNDFSLKLFKDIAANEKDKNIFISTIGMLYSLNIIHNAASGHTRQEIFNALNLDSTSVDVINSHCHNHH